MEQELKPSGGDFRSEVPPRSPEEVLAAATLPWWRRKHVLIIGGSILGLIIIALGAYAAVRFRGGEGGSDFFGNLPLSDLAERVEEVAEEVVPPKRSGLSGVECGHPGRRAIGVMLAGDPINRPVSGFASADWVWELPVLTSDVTRLTAFYQCNEPKDIGSVRSARHDYLFLADGLDAILAHWGGSYHALNRIAVGEFQTINALTNPHNAFFRKTHLPAPYNGFTTYERLWNALQRLGYRQETEFKGYEFKDDPPMEERPAGGTLTVNWPGAFRVHYEYDTATNRYQRFWAGVRQVDGEDNQTRVAPSAIIVARAENRLADGPGGYNEMAIEGEGDMTVYQDGRTIPGRWEKNVLNKRDPMIFTNQAGEPIRFTRGQIWAMAVEPHITVTWQALAAPPAP
ncbi:MAG: DUF3048 domain-containing protein [Patescibacteria group bacterium]